MKRFLVPLYGLRIFMCNDEAEMREFIQRHDGDPSACDKAQGVNYCWSDRNDDAFRVMAIFNGKVGTVAHEAVHMSWEILTICAVPIRDESNEAQAYLVDWLLTTFIRAFPEPKEPVTAI